MSARSSRTRRSLTLLHGSHPSDANASDPATSVVTRDAHGEVVLLEREGVFYRRELDQVRCKRHRLADRVRQQLVDLDKRAADLAERLVGFTWEEAIEDQDEVLRKIGWVLVTNGRRDLWQLVYLQANDGHEYRLGDEMTFLLDDPGSTAALS